MTLITADNLYLSRGTKTLFQEISFSVSTGDAIAIVGLNGCGKSSLLASIAGTVSCDSGNITRNRDCRIHSMVQQPEFNPDETVIDYIFREVHLPHTAAISSYLSITEEIAGGWSEDVQEKLDAVTSEMDALGAWEYEGKIKALLQQLGIADLKLKMGELSGGMVKKISLAQAVMAEADLLILDEPTNHLDIDTVLWLQDYLGKQSSAFLVVTHDRYFLDNVCNQIWEIDAGSLFTYRGNYSYFVEKKEERIEAERRRDYKARSLLRTEMEWLRRSPSARGTKQKARIDRIHDLMKVGTVTEESSAKISSSGRPLGKKVCQMKNVCFSYPETPILKNFTYYFKQKEKIGLIGQNGVGKSTFIDVLTGSLTPDSGFVDCGINTDFGVFSQTPNEMPMDSGVLSYLKTFAEVIEYEGEKITAAKFLENFCFPPRMHFNKIGSLSGGERRRLQLLTVLIKNPNFLILDEPTNDLDIETLTRLEQFLLQFSGSLIIISHDRYFLDKVCDYLLVMEGSGVVNGFPSSYSDYLVWSKERDRARKLEVKKSEPEKRASRSSDSRKISFNEKRELGDIEKRIDEIEGRLEQIFEEFQHLTGPTIADLKNEQSLLEDELQQKMERWEHLSLLDQ